MLFVSVVGFYFEFECIADERVVFVVNAGDLYTVCHGNQEESS